MLIETALKKSVSVLRLMMKICILGHGFSENVRFLASEMYDFWGKSAHLLFTENPIP